MRILNQDYLTEKEALKALGYENRVTLYRAREKGQLVGYKIGSRVFYKLQDLEAYVERSKVGGPVSTQVAA